MLEMTFADIAGWAVLMIIYFTIVIRGQNKIRIREETKRLRR
jgi:hypothetical protein